LISGLQTGTHTVRQAAKALTVIDPAKITANTNAVNVLFMLPSLFVNLTPLIFSPIYPKSAKRCWIAPLPWQEEA
jgi:hypothetical protein